MAIRCSKECAEENIMLLENLRMGMLNKTDMSNWAEEFAMIRCLIRDFKEAETN